MELVKPAIGLVFWMLFFFGIIFFILKKYAFPAIIKGLKEREDSIQSALDQARDAREEMNKLKSDNERILAEARLERDKLLKEKAVTRENARMEAILKELTKIYKDISKTYEEFEKEKDHIKFEHPEKGDAVERKYKRYRPKSVEEREAEAGLNGKLTRTKTRVQKTYHKDGEAVEGETKENLEKDMIQPKGQSAKPEPAPTENHKGEHAH